MATVLLDRGLIEEIRRIERATGRDNLLSGFVRELEGNLAGFGAAFSDCIARGDATGAVRAAHTLKGVSHPLAAQALGEVCSDLEHNGTPRAPPATEEPIDGRSRRT